MRKTLPFKNGVYKLIAFVGVSLALLAGCGGGGGGATQDPPKTYNLQVSKFGEGVIVSDINGINCGNDCTNSYNAGTQVLLTATNSSTNGYQFSSWAGCNSVNQNTCTVIMDGDKIALPTFTRAPVVRATTKIIDDVTLQNLVVYDGTTFSFNSQATAILDLNVGDIITGSTGMGFLRKVAAIYTLQDGSIIVETSEATLEDAIQEGSIAFSEQLVQANLMSATGLPKGVSLRKASGIDNNSDREFTFDFNNVVYDLNKKTLVQPQSVFDLPFGPYVTISGSTTLTFKPDIAVDFFVKEWQYYSIIPIPIPAVKEFKAVLLTTQTNNLKLTVASNVTVNEKVLIGTLKFGPYQVWTPTTPPIPFWFTPEFNIYLGLDGTAEAALTTSVSLTNDLSAGIKYTNNNSWEPVKNYSNVFSWEQPTLTGNASIQSYVSPEAVIWIDSVIGPRVNLKSYIGMDATASVSSSAFAALWRLYFGLDASAGFKIDPTIAKIIGTLPDYGVDVLDPNPEWDLASGGLYSLTVLKTGTGNGTVTSNVAGINCGSDCSEIYPSGIIVTLTPSPASGSTFAGWSGGGCSGIGSCNVTMDALKTVTATFNAASISSYALTVSKNGTGSGTVTANTGTITWSGNTGTATYASGITVTLTQSATSGSTFAGWNGGGCSGTGTTCTVTMDAVKTVTATFNAASIYLSEPTLTSPPDGGGNQSTTPTFIWTAVSGATSYRIMVATSPSALPTDPTVSTCSGCVINVTPTYSYYTPSAGVLSSGTTYYWQVHARSATYYGLWSSKWSFTTLSSSTTTPLVSSVSPNTITQGTSYQNVTVYGSNFTSSSYHQLSIDGGSTWNWATTAPTFNNSTSMTIAVSNTTVRTVYIRVCASYGSSACSGSVSVVIQAPSSTSQVERITNGGFVSDTSGWSRVGDFWYGTTLDYTGRYRTYPGYAAGGVDITGLPKINASGYMYQTLTIPSGATSATFSFWLNITSDEITTTTQYDKLYIEVLNSSGTLLTTLATYSNLDKGSACGSTCVYNQKSFNLTSYKGQTIRIQFRATTDSGLDTVFRIDDVSLMSDG